MKAGHDTQSCGSTEQSACKTLPWALCMFYECTQHYSILPALDLEIDQDLVFDRKLMVNLANHFPNFTLHYLLRMTFSINRAYGGHYL